MTRAPTGRRGTMPAASSRSLPPAGQQVVRLLKELSGLKQSEPRCQELFDQLRPTLLNGSSFAISTGCLVFAFGRHEARPGRVFVLQRLCGSFELRSLGSLALSRLQP